MEEVDVVMTMTLYGGSKGSTPMGDNDSMGAVTSDKWAWWLLVAWLVKEGAADSQTAMQRLRDEVIGNELFKNLREMHGTGFEAFLFERMIPVAGNIARENLGIADSKMMEEMWREVTVTFSHSKVVVTAIFWEESGVLGFALPRAGKRSAEERVVLGPPRYGEATEVLCPWRRATKESFTRETGREGTVRSKDANMM
ncbi:hypothetical protein Scep_015522 [Stephania cephalantha]|uniref:Thioester reductase (TE) domain-containing protein n=1 Tax=Stephania cephalantha TaxID=152367 RepID=A0AAP0J5T0_9MAGN